MLHELGLDYETRAIIPRSAEMDDPELARWTRRHKIPFFEDGEIRIGESGAIVLYLADRYRDRARLAPEPGTPARAAFEELAFFVLMELDATALYVLRRHEGLPDVYGEAPAACDAARLLRAHGRRDGAAARRRPAAPARRRVLGRRRAAGLLSRMGAGRSDSARRAARGLSRPRCRTPRLRARDAGELPAG